MVNIVLLALDTLRADHLGCYGYKRNTSPFIDQLARDGVLFERFFAPNIPTHPSFTTMHSGKEAITHNIVNIGAKAQLSPDVRLLAEILHDAGYLTVAVDNLRRHFPRGFDIYKDYTWDRSQPGVLRKAEAVNEQLLPVLSILQEQKKPFFLFVHYWDPHTPYLPPEPYKSTFYPEGHDPYDKNNASMDNVWAFEPFRWYFHSWMPGITDTEFVNAQYDGEVRYLDDHLRPVIEMMDRGHLLKNTVVFVTADHGEVLDEHEGYYDHHGLYDANIHIPLIVWSPSFLPRGRRVHGFCENLDLAPTILEWCDVPDQEHMEGKSLVPSLYGLRDGNYRDMYFSEASWQVKRAIRTEQWKLIKALLPSFHVGSPERELYNLEADPDEQHNLAERHPEIVATLEAKLDGYVARRLAETGRSLDPCIEQGVSGTRIGTPPADLENYGRNYIPLEHAAPHSDDSRPLVNSKLDSHSNHGYVRIDLHCHTTWSNGFTSPIELIHHASLNDITILAITDHHATAGYREAREEAHTVGVTLIPAIELDCWYAGRRADLLGYWIDPDHPELAALLQHWPSGTGQLFSDDLFYRSLNTLLPSPLTPADIENALSSGSQALLTLMRLLVQHGFAPTLGQAFQRFHDLQQTRTLERKPRHYVPVEEAAPTLRAAGGIVALAHPAILRNDDLVRDLAQSGLIDAIEAPYTSYWIDKDAKNQRYATIAEETGLARTAGSDYHAYPQSTTQLGVDVEEPFWNALLNLRRVRSSR